MNYNNFRRGRTPPPPFVYEEPMRSLPNHRDFDNAYHPAQHSFDASGRPYSAVLPHPCEPQMPMYPHHPTVPPSAQHSFIDLQSNHNNYPPNYTDHLYRRQSPTSPYRTAISHREPYLPPVATHPLQARSSSPPYKILCITNINTKINDNTVKEALTSDFSRFGDISVSVCHDSGERLAYIYFRNCEEAREARQFKTRTMFFDRPIEIEPIFEPVHGSGSPRDSSSPTPMMPPNGLPSHSPRKRSLTPPNYSRDINGPATYRRQGPQKPGNDLPTSPHLLTQHRGPSSPDYSPNPGAYVHGQSPPPSISGPNVSPYNRKSHHSGYNPFLSPHITSPYSSPPHEQYRSSHHTNHMLTCSQTSLNAHTRERLHGSTRSPHNEIYYPSEARAPSASHHLFHHSSLKSSSGSGHHAPSLIVHGRQSIPAGSNRGQPLATRHHHNYPPEPPARFMSREYRRGKFGGDPHSSEHDEGKPSRVLLVNNIDATKTEKELREIFEEFGTIEEMEIKSVAPEILSALIKFSSMDGAYKAKTANNGRHIGNLRCRIVYGKVTLSKRLWIGGLSPATTVSSMDDECSKYGDITHMDYTAGRPYCYVEYDTANQTQFAAHQLRTTLTPASERKIRVEFVDPERSEKLAPRHDSEKILKRAIKETTYEQHPSQRSISGILGQRKRSISPLLGKDLLGLKRKCQFSDELLSHNLIKQEGINTAARSKTRATSTTSSTPSHSVSDKGEKMREAGDCNEMNNNSDTNQAAERVNNFIVTNQISNNEGNHNNAQKHPSPTKISQCTSVKDIVRCCNVSWPGQIALRNFIFPAQIHMCSGRKQFIDRFLSRPNGTNGNPSSPLLRITQRWRMHPQPKLAEVKRRMQSGNLGILILTARHEGAKQSVANSNINLAPMDNTALVSICSDRSNELQQGCSQELAFDKVQHNGESNKSATPKLPNSLDKTDSTTAEMAACNESASNHMNSANQSEVDLTSKNDRVAAAAAAVRADLNQTSAPTAASTNQSRPLRNLISYLEQKDAAGVISLSAIDNNSMVSSGATTDTASKLLYAFPPGDFALNLLKRKAANLTPDAMKEEYLLGVIVGGNVEGGKI